MPPSSLVSRLATASTAPAAAEPVSLQRHPPHGASAAHDDAPGVHQRVRAVPVDFTSSPRPPISGEAEKFVTGSPVAATEGPLTAPKGVWASTRPGLGLWHPFREGGRGQESWRRRGPQELKARERRRLRVSIGMPIVRAIGRHPYVAGSSLRPLLPRQGLEKDEVRSLDDYPDGVCDWQPRGSHPRITVRHPLCRSSSEHPRSHAIRRNSRMRRGGLAMAGSLGGCTR